MARALRAEERRKLGQQALDLSGLGLTNTDIASRLGVNRKTVPGLIEDAAAEADPGIAVEAARAKAHYRRIVRTCWQKIADKSLSVNSHNVPALIGQAASAQARLDKLNGIESAMHLIVEEKKSVADLARETQGVPPERRLRLVDEGI